MMASNLWAAVRDSALEGAVAGISPTEPDVRASLKKALYGDGDGEGIWRGPFLHAQLPLRSTPPGWESPLQWLPEGFVPFQHQGEALNRLSVSGQLLKPTILTAASGAGKSESFLLPILDHCSRQRRMGRPGIKAIVVYRSSASAVANAAIVAGICATDPRMTGVSGGLLLDDLGSSPAAGPSHLVDSLAALIASPPDLLLTTPKMLNRLLQGRGHQEIFATTSPASLRYIVLDDLYGYEPPELSDLAILVRRLGARLRMATPSVALSGAVPVVTGSVVPTAENIESLCRTAEQVLGVEFVEESIISESRQSVDELCPSPDSSLPQPSAERLAQIGVEDIPAILAAFFATGPDSLIPNNAVELSAALTRHPFTAAVLTTLSERCSMTQAVSQLGGLVPAWRQDCVTNPKLVAEALQRFLTLLGVARLPVGSRTLPFVLLTTHLWLRQTPRLMRRLDSTPEFKLPEQVSIASPATMALASIKESTSAGDDLYLPAVYCSSCGRSGWLGAAVGAKGTLVSRVVGIDRPLGRQDGHLRILISAAAGDPTAMHLDVSTRRLGDEADDSTVPVHVSVDDNSAHNRVCPACNEPGAVRFVGVSGAELVSNAVDAEFAAATEESSPKLLAMNDSVQEASIQASHLAGRSYSNHLREQMSAALNATASGSIALSDIANALVAAATTTHQRFQLVPPDLRNDPKMQTLWSDTPDQGAAALLALRLGFEADLEFGRRASEPDSLTSRGEALAVADLGGLSSARAHAIAVLGEVLGEVPESVAEGVDGYLLGILDRLRSIGAFQNSLLDPYVSGSGDGNFLANDRPDGLPPFRDGQQRPRFLTTDSAAGNTEFESISNPVDRLGGGAAWPADWAVRSLGVNPEQAVAVNQRVIESLAGHGEAITGLDTSDGHRVYGLARRSVRIVDVSAERADSGVTRLRCDKCSEQITLAPSHTEAGVGSACFRYGCSGHFGVDPIGGESAAPHPAPRALDAGAAPAPGAEPMGSNPARKVSGAAISAEMTAATPPLERMTLEWKFRHGALPDSPNVVVATPMVEARIDSAEVSTLVLASMPKDAAHYLRRTVRAGSLAGTATVVVVVPDDPSGSRPWSDPKELLGSDGGANGQIQVHDPAQIDVKPADYLAFLFDRVADQSIPFNVGYESIGDLMRVYHGEEGLVHALAGASARDAQFVDRFLGLFGDHITPETDEQIRDYAKSGVEVGLLRVSERWQNQVRDLDGRRAKLSSAMNTLGSRSDRDAAATDELWQLAGYLDSITTMAQQLVAESWIDVLAHPQMAALATGADDNPEATATALTFTLWHRGRDQARNLTIKLEGSRSEGLTTLAPGNDFHVVGHRQVINAIDIGSDDALAIQQRSICPDCSYVTSEDLDSSDDSGSSDDESQSGDAQRCPRCGSSALASDDSAHRFVDAVGAVSAGSEVSARVANEEAGAVEPRYRVVTLVDVDPKDVTKSWTNSAGTFGVQRCSPAQIRDFAGEVRGGSTQTSTGDGGSPVEHISVLTACRHCGGIKPGSSPIGKVPAGQLHQGWCGVRIANWPEEWEQIHLMHEHRAQAVRLLIPVSDFQATERLTNLKAALLLGASSKLDESIDGIDAAISQGPTKVGGIRQQYLVLHSSQHDAVPALDALADAGRLKEALSAALDLISRCDCNHTGLNACGKCLLGFVDKSEFELIRRDLAVETLQAILSGWTRPQSPEALATPTGASDELKKFEKNELHRAFKVALQIWAACDLDVEASFLSPKDIAPALELSIKFQGKQHRYKLQESTKAGEPAFTVTPLAEAAPTVEVYLEAYESDASERARQVSEIAESRAARRDSGVVTWNLTWDDIREFYNAGASAVPHEVVDHLVLSANARRAANDAHEELEGIVSVDSIEQNSVALLLDFLARPKLGQWRRAMTSAVEGLLSSGELSAGEGTYLDPYGVEVSVSSVDAASETASAAPNYLATASLPEATPTAGDAADVGDSSDSGDMGVKAHDPVTQWSGWLFWDNLLQFLQMPAKD